MWEFQLNVHDAKVNCLFHDILKNSIEAGDSGIARGGTIHTRPVISSDNII
jgi:hypothetical protein